MERDKLILGLIGFCAGIVLFINVGSLLNFNQYPVSGGALAVSIVVEFIIAVLIFGGLVLIVLALREPKVASVQANVNTRKSRK